MKITELLLHHINECSKYYNICNGIKIDIENSVADFINKEYLHYSFIHENKKKYYCVLCDVSFLQINMTHCDSLNKLKLSLYFCVDAENSYQKRIVNKINRDLNSIEMYLNNFNYKERDVFIKQTYELDVQKSFDKNINLDLKPFTKNR